MVHEGRLEFDWFCPALRASMENPKYRLRARWAAGPTPRPPSGSNGLVGRASGPATCRPPIDVGQ
eukprot:10936431-Alexandrium_andersonii.AAC.1